MFLNGVYYQFSDNFYAGCATERKAHHIDIPNSVEVPCIYITYIYKVMFIINMHSNIVILCIQSTNVHSTKHLGVIMLELDINYYLGIITQAQLIMSE